MRGCALITGASGAIGGATALRLAAEGYAVAACYCQDAAGIERLAAKLASANAVFRCCRLDVTDAAAVNALFEELETQFAPIEVLVNNAGVAQQALLQDTTNADYDRLADVNLKGVFLCCRAAVPAMVRRKHGAIINVASMWGRAGASCEAVYSATKAGVIGLTQALARELAPSGVRVNCVAPGAIDTKMNDHFSAQEKAALAAEIPLGRFGTPEEVAAAIAFLASKDAGYITAQTLGVDGGMI
ncbi:MAG: 3-oxoacyl-ACP reductase FabG [Clostridia bacterium]|nr:3-oxoacyl-ACP reductase FabG [Clostridia bacterium]